MEKIMAFSSCPSKIYDPLRHEWVAATPEEHVRQSVIKLLLDLGYPRGCMSVETSLSQLHQLNENPLPKRRADLVIFKEMKPIFLIECKAGKIKPEALRQLVGYNVYVKASWIALANPEGIWVRYFDFKSQNYEIREDFPLYIDL